MASWPVTTGLKIIYFSILCSIISGYDHHLLIWRSWSVEARFTWSCNFTTLANALLTIWRLYGSYETQLCRCINYVNVKWFVWRELILNAPLWFLQDVVYVDWRCPMESPKASTNEMGMYRVKMLTCRLIHFYIYKPTQKIWVGGGSHIFMRQQALTTNVSFTTLCQHWNKSKFIVIDCIK